MIENRTGDILEQGDLTHIVHQANLFHTFGAGIAYQIKEKFPYAYEADKKTNYGDKAKLGTFSVGSAEGKPIIINLYSQDGIGGQNRLTDYDAMGKGLYGLKGYLENQWPLWYLICPVLGIPYGIGCGLANGDWKIVGPLIHAVFANSDIKVVICKLP